MAFFSVIIPTYNSEVTLADCLQSLAIQNFRDFEVLIIDGESSDNTVSSVKTFLKNYPDLEFTIISEKDNGIYHAMNKGAALARGKWLYFLGCDDRLMSDDIFNQVCMESSKPHSPDFYYGNALIKETGNIYDGKFNFRHLLKANICHQSTFIRKSLFDELGGFDLRFKVHADWDLNLKVFLAGKNIQFDDIIVVQYSNQGFSSITRDIIFEEKLKRIKERYYRNFKNRFNSRVHHLKKRVVKYFIIS